MSKHRGRARLGVATLALSVAAGLAVAGCGVQPRSSSALESGAAQEVRISAAAPLPASAPDRATERTLERRVWVTSAVPAGFAASTAGSVAPPVSSSRSTLPANRLLIPSLSVYAPIDLAHAASGELQLPSDASRVARYDASPDFGARAGTTIVAGHVTNTPQIGVLFPLATIRPNALVYTTDSHDRLRTWRVVSVSAPLKADLPHSIFTATGPRRLAIVTCGGDVTWNADGTRSYPRNVIVIARPVRAS